MLLKSKEELNGAARIFLNNLVEFYNEEILDLGNTRPAQTAVESAEWVHIYNLGQRMLFINPTEPHFGVLGELERESDANARDNNFRLRYRITEEGIKLRFTEIEGSDADLEIEIWSLERATRGLKLNMPSGN